MKDDIKQRIDEYFQKIAEEQAALKAAKEARERREEEGIVRFLDMIDTLIKPTLGEMAAYITERGTKAEIIVRGPKGNDKGIVTQHSVEVSFPDSMKPGVVDPPHFRLQYNKAELIVSLFRRTNDYNLPGERHTLDEITKEWLEDEFSKFFVKGL
jgi:hypothetical protein